MINGAITAITKLVNKKLDRVSAVIVAAGKSTRMEGVDKIFVHRVNLCVKCMALKKLKL